MFGVATTSPSCLVLTGVAVGDELQPGSSHKLRGAEGGRPQDRGGDTGSVQ